MKCKCASRFGLLEMYSYLLRISSYFAVYQTPIPRVSRARNKINSTAASDTRLVNRAVSWADLHGVRKTITRGAQKSVLVPSAKVIFRLGLPNPSFVWLAH